MQAKIKIIHVVTGLPRGGLEKVVFDICKNIDKDKFEISVCCLVYGGNMVAEFEKIGIKLFYLSAVNKMQIKHIPKNFIEICKLAKLYRKQKIDVVHSHEFFPAGIARIAAILAGIRKVYVSIHSQYEHLSSSQFKINRFLSRFTKKIIANSNHTKSFSMKNDGIPKEKYKVIYNGISIGNQVPKFDNLKLKEKYGLNESDLIIGNVGNISYKKGQEYLIMALPIILEKFKNTKLVIVGEEVPFEKKIKIKLENLAESLGVADKIIWTGRVKNASELMSIFDVYVMSSVVEGFGIALIEAMLAERICVASSIDVFKEIIEDGKNGFIFESENPEHLARQVIHSLLLESDKKNGLIENAVNTVKNKFSIRKIVNEYEKLYETN